MNCEEYQKIMMGLLDEELGESEETELKKHLSLCSECRLEFDRFKYLKQITDSARIQTPEDKFWEGYWAGIYNKMERGFGWILTLAGGVLLLAAGCYWTFFQVIVDQSLPIVIRCGIPLVAAGLIVLLISVIRERCRAYQTERYKDVRR